MSYRLMDRGLVALHEFKFADGVRRESEPHAAGSVEHLVITDGRLLTGPIGEEVEVAAGDYVSFPSDRPHVYEALGGQARALLLHLRPTTLAPAGDAARARSRALGRGHRRRSLIGARPDASAQLT
jgi:mannose-6-phosphate isomerase-like protein (cupin superfamily)